MCDPITIPITDELDLHHFRPNEVGPLVRDYIDECAKLNISPVKLIHGKGIGTLRTTVHKTLEKHPKVLSYKLAAPNWGATVATLDGHGGDSPAGG